MSISEPLTVLKSELLEKIVPELVNLLASAQQDGRPVHKVEEDCGMCCCGLVNGR